MSEPAVRPKNTVAVFALVLGVIGFLAAFIPTAGLVLGIPGAAAIVCGVAGSTTANRPRGRIWMALLGGALGLIGVVIIFYRSQR